MWLNKIEYKVGEEKKGNKLILILIDSRMTFESVFKSILYTIEFWKHF